jgi:hypothetical protein
VTAVRGPRLGPAGPVWWTVTGAALGVGLVSLLTVGALLLLAGLVMAVVGARRERWRRSAPLVLLGAVAAPLLLAWLNRAGPGSACTVSGTTTSCTDQYSPWPFLAVALVLAVVGPVLAGRAASA